MLPNLPPSHSAGYGDIDPWLQQLRSDNLPQQPVQQPMEGYSQMVESSISPPLGDQIQESGTPPSTALTQADPAQVEGDGPLNPINIDDNFPPSSTLAPATEWVNVTDLVYAAKEEEPGKDDMIHEAWIFMNWMRSHRSELSFDEKAKTHKWFVSANDYKRLFYVRVDDGTKEYGWGLENRLRRLYASGRGMGQQPKRTKTKQARSRNPREQRQPGRKEQEEKRGRARKEEQQGQKEESHAHRRKGRERIKKPNGSGRRGRRRRRQQQNESHLEHNEKSEANNYPEGDVEERVRLEDGSEDPEMADLVADCERLMEEESEESEEE